MKIQLVITLLLLSFFGFSQATYEGEHRILKSQFPEKANAIIQNNITGVKKLKYYQEIDSNSVFYKAKFKKDRLRYTAAFTAGGELENMSFLIKPIDIPSDSYTNISLYLKRNFTSHKARLIEQQYKAEDEINTTLKNTLQNLIIPSIVYKFTIKGKSNNETNLIEISFDANGQHIHSRTALPNNHDHVLY